MIETRFQSLSLAAISSFSCFSFKLCKRCESFSLPGASREGGGMTSSSYLSTETPVMKRIILLLSNCSDDNDAFIFYYIHTFFHPSTHSFFHLLVTTSFHSFSIYIYLHLLNTYTSPSIYLIKPYSSMHSFILYTSIYPSYICFIFIRLLILHPSMTNSQV